MMGKSMEARGVEASPRNEAPLRLPVVMEGQDKSKQRQKRSFLYFLHSSITVLSCFKPLASKSEYIALVIGGGKNRN